MISGENITAELRREDEFPQRPNAHKKPAPLARNGAGFDRLKR
jgi:hypothetical protein